MTSRDPAVIAAAVAGILAAVGVLFTAMGALAGVVVTAYVARRGQKDTLLTKAHEIAGGLIDDLSEQVDRLQKQVTELSGEVCALRREIGTRDLAYAQLVAERDALAIQLAQHVQGGTP